MRGGPVKKYYSWLHSISVLPVELFNVVKIFVTVINNNSFSWSIRVVSHWWNLPRISRNKQNQSPAIWADVCSSLESRIESTRPHDLSKRCPNLERKKNKEAFQMEKMEFLNLIELSWLNAELLLTFTRKMYPDISMCKNLTTCNIACIVSNFAWKIQRNW